MDNCRICGARLFEGASYCARCLSPLSPSDAEVAEGLAEVSAAGGRWVDPRPAAHAPPAPEAPAPEKVHSRWRGGATSFGAPTKLGVTAFLILTPLLMWKVLGLWAIEFGLVWCVAVVPRVLGDLWKRSRIR